MEPDGQLTAEIRWWGEGNVPAQIAGWFAAGDIAPGKETTRTDHYLPTGSEAVGAKFRGGTGQLELKSRIGRVAMEKIGEAGVWIKHSIPAQPDVPTMAVTKRRRLRIFDLAGTDVTEIAVGPDGEGPEDGYPIENCSLELARIECSGADWWTVCFEAAGPFENVAANLARTIHHMAPLPEALTTASRAGYPAWLLERG